MSFMYAVGCGIAGLVENTTPRYHQQARIYELASNLHISVDLEERLST